MRLLQRYVLIELIRIFAFLLTALTFMLVFVGVFQKVRELGLGPDQVLLILPFLVPSLLPFIIPATFLLTVCVVYGRMAGDHEITAAKAAGINVFSLLWPAFLLGAAISVCSLLLTDQVIPWAEKKIQQQVSLFMEDIFLEKLRTYHQVTDTRQGFSIIVKGVDGKTLIEPTFDYTPRGHTPVTVAAQEATLEFDLENRQVILHLVRGEIDAAGDRHIDFEQEDQAFPLPYKDNGTKPRHRSIREIAGSVSELNGEIESLRRQRDVETAFSLLLGDFDRLSHDDLKEYKEKKNSCRTDLAGLRTAMHSRFALSSSCLFFALLGAPFSIIREQRQFLTSFFVCFVPILLLYYPLALGMMNISKSGIVDPAWAMWLSNGIVLIAAAITLRKVLSR
jgi:lipopolysaccharide export system permease protein